MPKPTSSFAKASEAKPKGLVAELWHYITHNKKWWLTPIVVVIFAIGALVLLGGSGAAPFIYPLF